MTEHERGYTEGYQESMKIIYAMVKGGVPLAVLREALEEELDEST